MAVCPSCGRENPEGFNFCGFCTAALDGAPVPQVEERKVVSILFVDLVGFTARSHDLDPEDVRAALAPYHQRLKREIESFGGTVEKFIGDAVMAVFGAPVAHEDDAQRAVRAALRITEAIEELNEEADLDLSIRAAVNTGEGLVNLSARPQSGEGMVTGDVVNTASRLQGVAPVNGVVVGEITYRSTKDFIVYDEVDAVYVKGKPEPVPVWRAVSARSHSGVDAQVRYRTPFIGRDFDLATLRTAYQRTTRESSLQLVTLVGEPGVGKTRLLAEFASYVDDQPELITWRQGRSLPYGEGITFWALGEIVKAQAGINESDSADVAKDKMGVALGSLIDDEADRAWLQQRLAPLVGATSLGGAAEKEESFAAWLHFLEVIATKDPMVLVFEDLHWADASLLEFIEHLVEWSTGVPILVVGTARPELFEKHPHWAGGTRNATTISLSPLTDAETAQLISALLSHAVLPAEIHTALLERAGGNPLYAEEFIRMLVDRSVLRARGRTLSVDPDADIPIPDNVQALIAARLDTLPPERKSLLHNAAVVGKVFWSGAVASLSDLEEPLTRRSLQELVRKELIRPVRMSSIEGEQEYSFWHALTRDVAYGEIPRSQRAAKHQGVAGWLEDVAGERVTDHAEVLAHHYQSAMELLESSGASEMASEIVSAAVRFLVLAGERALDLDVAKARRYFEAALPLAPDERRGQVLARLADTARKLDDLDAAIVRYKEAIGMFALLGDKVGEGGALRGLSIAYWWVGDNAPAMDLDLQAIEVLEEAGLSTELASAYNGMSQNVLMIGRPPEEAIEWAEKAEVAAQAVGSGKESVVARANRALGLCDLGDARGYEGLVAAYEEALKSAWTEDAAVIGSGVCLWQWCRGGPKDALQTYEVMIEREERRGLVHAARHERAESLWMLYDLGDWDLLLDVADELIAWAEQRRVLVVKAAALPCIAQVIAFRQQIDKAESWCEESLLLTRKVEEVQKLAPALAVAALVAQMRGAFGEAVDLIEELDQVTRHSPPWRSRHLPTALRVFNSAGQLDKAETFASGIKVTATRDVNCVLTGQAILAEAKGRAAEARDLHQQAAQRWADYGFVLEEGQAHLGLARCLITLGDREGATVPLRKAQTIFSHLGAVPLLKEVEGYLGKAQAASG
jgi:class 3 adenylate cyclase/tetratricopeptide (TPR) repeat protein